MTKHSVAISGAAGRVGVNIVQHLLKMGYDVHALVRAPLAAGHPLTREDATVTTLDLATLAEPQIAQWLAAVRPHAFIHAAALADPAACERQPSLAYLMNAQATRMLARACAQSQTHLIMLSTEHVFGGAPQPQTLYHECDPVQPLNHYGKSKVQGELATQEECAGNALWTICRISTVYGLTGGSPQWHRPDFVQWVLSMLERNEAFNVVTDQVNSPIYANDLIAILGAVVQQRLQGIYHVAGSTPISRYHFARKVAQTYNLNEALIQPICTAKLGLSLQRALNVGLCVDKISRASGIAPLSLEEGLARYKEQNM
ncbi:MAG TPA: SDR family oxidoreductase [Ktedonobacteraceae bacterium]|nr:SDR family oxidoreductase [Ktedonobacteraceae bacterium]